MGNAPQASHDAAGGRAATVAAGASSLPAHVPCRRSGSGCVITSSPSRSSATPEPTAATVPAASVPSAIGAGPPICQLPILTSSSQLPMPAATTSIRTSPAAGVGGSSTSKISTGSPSAVIPAARILLGARYWRSIIHGRGHGRTRRLVSANLEHDLATLPAARDSLERRPGLREPKKRVDLRAKLACIHERSQLQQLLAVGFDDEVDRARHLLCDRDHALASGDLAAASVEHQIDRTALHDRCAGVSRKLDSDVPNPARGARDQHPLPSGEPPVHKQCLPGG